MYLKLLLHLLHHVNFYVTAAVHLAHIARKDFSNTHVSIISDIKLNPTVFQKFLLGRTLGQHGWSPRLNKAGLGDFDIKILRVIRLGRAREFQVVRTIDGFLDRRVSSGRWYIMGWLRRRLMRGGFRCGSSKFRFI